jgi:hypothetical protein
VVHSVLVIEMPLNNLNVSVSDPKWLRTVQVGYVTKHHCSALQVWCSGAQQLQRE